MKIVIIGGSGHVGTYLLPQLVNLGHTVINVSRQLRKPYFQAEEWKYVQQITLDRTENADFDDQISSFLPDVIIDMICFTPASAERLVNAVRGKVGHFIHCGTMWVHGHSYYVPATENQPRKPICDYGQKKLEIETYLLEQAELGFPATILHPGHITGPGWMPINPAGNLNPEVFRILANGNQLALPNLGMETLHHVHADDVASAFLLAVNNPSKSIGEAFHVVSEQAITLRGYAAHTASWFEREADLSFHCWEEWKTMVSHHDSELTWDHIAHSPNGSIEKVKRLLGFKPKYSAMEAVKEALDWQILENNLLRR